MFKSIKSTRTLHTGIETDVVSDMLWRQIAYLDGWFQSLGVMKSVYSLFKVFNFVQKTVCIKLIDLKFSGSMQRSKIY